MATRQWLGIAPAVAQVTTVQVTGYDAATTYAIEVNGIAIASVPGTTNADDTASALQAAWEASDSPYAEGITATVSTDTVTLTGTAGLPFTVTASDTGGSGTIGSPSTTTAATGPNFWDNAANWSGGAVPIDADDVVIRDSAVPIAWGLDQSAIELGTLRIEASYTGTIGLLKSAVATSADAQTTDASAIEYREDYLIIGYTTCRIGDKAGPGLADGAGRIKINNDENAASETHIIQTAAQGTDLNLPAIRLLLANSSANVFVRSAQGGVGIAVEAASETATVGAVTIADTTEVSQVFTGPGTTVTTWRQTGGQNVLEAAADVTTVEIEGGQLRIDGAFKVGTLQCNGGRCVANNADGSNVCATTATVNGGRLDLLGSAEARTIGTLNPNGGEIALNPDVITLSAINEPDGAAVISIDPAVG